KTSRKNRRTVDGVREGGSRRQAESRRRNEAKVDAGTEAGRQNKPRGGASALSLTRLGGPRPTPRDGPPPRRSHQNTQDSPRTPPTPGARGSPPSVASTR